VEYNEHGFAAGAPLPPDRWRTLCPDEPLGLVVSQGVVPPGVLVLQNYLSAAVCARLREECDRTPGGAATTDREMDPSKPRSVQDETRICELVPVDGLSVDVVSMVRNVWTSFVAPHYRTTVDTFEKPDILRYRQGGLYRPHTDAENWDGAGRRWVRRLDRDLSLLVYLNDDFKGGQLVFSNFGGVLPPRAGMVVAFPSDHRYIHAAKEVAEGVRYAIVSWATCRGSPRVEPQPRPNVIRI
jgi:predicted 2-oxoglutarate/Fe(II)-dependent dioxygenase YbiX